MPAAATLTAVLVGFELKVLDESVLNGAVLMILITCITSSLVTEKAGRQLAIEESDKTPDLSNMPSRILVPISNPSTIEQLVDFAIFLKEHHSKVPIFALAVAKDTENPEAELIAKHKMLERAIHHAAAVEQQVQLVTRIDMNIASGILRAVRELLITKVVIGWNGKISTRERVFGSILDNLLEHSYQMIMVCKFTHPVNTMRRMVVTAPLNAGLEKGFSTWVIDLYQIAKQIGVSILFYADAATMNQIQAVVAKRPVNIEVSHRFLENGDDLLAISREVSRDDLLVVISARSATLSYNSQLDKIPGLLARYFEPVSFVILYPEQQMQDV